jgi:hypothetical protein
VTFSPEFVLQIIVAIGAGFGSYAAIRADLATLHERTTNTAARIAELAARLDNH